MPDTHRLRFPGRRIVAVVGAKGGVGTSMIASNLGIFLAQIGKRVLLVDIHTGNSGLYAWLAMQRPGKNLDDLLSGRIPAMSDVAVETRINGLFLLSGSDDPFGFNGGKRIEFSSLRHHLQHVDADYVIIDLPGGLDPSALSFFVEADNPIIVAQATADAIESAYRFMCAAWWQRVRQVLADSAPQALSVLDDEPFRRAAPRTPRAVMAFLQSAVPPPEWLHHLHEISCTFRPQLIVNQTRIKEDEHLAGAMKSAATRWLGITPEILGAIGWDDNVWLALRRSKQLLIDFTNTRASRDLEQIVRHMLQLHHREIHSPSSIPPALEAQNLYEILEVYPGASEEEIRRAFKQIRTWFGQDSIAVRGVCSEEERQRFQHLAEEAHALLVDRFRRREYDRTHFPEGFAATPERFYSAAEPIGGAVVAARATLPEVVLRDDQFIDGAFLGRIRREHNVELIDISNRAKISVAYLSAIEEERFTDLPAPVFTRGFVHEFARYLKIDPRRATKDFMAKYESFAERRKPK